MTVMGLYIIFDRVAQEGGPIFEAKNDMVAYRNFQRLVNKMEHQEDFRLMKVGKYLHDTVRIEVLDVPTEVLNGSEEDIQNELDLIKEKR